MDVTKFHRVDAKTWRRLRIGAGVAAFVAVTAELILVCSYGYTLGSGWASGALYVSIFGLFTAIYAFGVPAAAGAAQRGFRGLPLMLLALWLCSAVLQGASVYGYYQDRGEGRRVEAVRAVTTKSDAELRYEGALARVEALKSAPSVRSAQISVEGLEARLNGMRQEREALPANYRSKRADLTLQIASLEGDLSAAKDRLAQALDRADAEKARDEALKELQASAASTTASGAALTRIGDEGWYRWLRTIAHLAASFLCPLVWLAATHKEEKAEEAEMEPWEADQREAKKTWFDRLKDIFEQGAAAVLGDRSAKPPADEPEAPPAAPPKNEPPAPDPAPSPNPGADQPQPQPGAQPDPDPRPSFSFAPKGARPTLPPADKIKEGIAA